MPRWVTQQVPRWVTESHLGDLGDRAGTYLKLLHPTLMLLRPSGEGFNSGIGEWVKEPGPDACTIVWLLQTGFLEFAQLVVHGGEGQLPPLIPQAA